MKTANPVKLSRPCIGAIVLRVLPVLLVLPTAAAPLRMATEAFATSAAQEAAQAAQERAVADAKANTTAATNALSAALTAAIPTDNAQLANGAGYVTKAVTNGLLKTETDPRFTAWADAHLVNDGTMVDWARDAIYAQYLGDATAPVKYSAEDITAISNGFAAADESLASRLSLASIDATNYTDFAIGSAIAPANPTFSNAVLSVGLGIDTNTVAAINALVEAGDELPIGGAATVGGLLLALAAAVAALKRTKADASALRYAMPAAVALVADNDAATLVCGDRAVTNATIASGFATLNLTFPAAVSGYVRDFYLRITVAAGESAPALSLPQGITIENAGGAVPEIADGEASAAATTLVWFSETAPGVFTAKSETVKAVV